MVNFTKEKISEHVTRIVGVPGVCVYLAEGRDRALLIDTGFGIGDLKSYVETLTHKPYDVVITHGHLDHAGGCAQFGQVYIDPRDMELLKCECALDKRVAGYEDLQPLAAMRIDHSQFIADGNAALIPTSEGQLFDLGGLTIKIICLPGHTLGSVVLLDVEERIAFFGDAVGTGVLLLKKEHAASVERYRQALANFRKYDESYDTAIRQHGTFTASHETVDNVLEACERILNGTSAEQKTRLFSRYDCLSAFEIDPVTKMRLDGRDGNIFYTTEMIN